MDYTIVGFVCGSMDELIRYAAYLLWQKRQNLGLPGTPEADWLEAKRLITPCKECLQNQAHQVYQARTADGTPGTEEHDWLYAELVVASRSFHYHFDKKE